MGRACVPSRAWGCVRVRVRPLPSLEGVTATNHDPKRTTWVYPAHFTGREFVVRGDWWRAALALTLGLLVQSCRGMLVGNVQRTSSAMIKGRD